MEADGTNVQIIHPREEPLLSPSGELVEEVIPWGIPIMILAVAARAAAAIVRVERPYRPQRTLPELALDLRTHLVVKARTEVRRLSPLSGAARNLAHRGDVDAHRRAAVWRTPGHVRP